MLVVLVVHDGAAWLRQCLIGLSRQTHPRLGILAVDNGSSDASPEMLETTLGSERVIRLGPGRTFSSAASEALRTAAADRADYVLLLRDDTVLAPEAVERMVETAERVDGAGIIGAKVLDALRPQVLQNVGESVDRFGYPYSPLEGGEIDQGQYDRVREVMAVSSGAMLVRRDLPERIGLPDDRLPARFADVGFGWRARVAGYRVLMTPSAVAARRSPQERGDGVAAHGARRARFQRERAALANLLENDGWLTLLWTLPLWLAQAFVRSVYLLLSRRFESAYQMAAAVGWNVRRFPGTMRIRRTAQRARRDRDHRVHRFMAPAVRQVRGWAASIGEWAQPGAGEEEDAHRSSGWVLAGRFVMAHPLLVAWVLAGLLAAVSYRHLVSASPISGGAVAAFPSSPADFFNELVSGVRTTGLGGTQAASPALGLLGVGSVLSFASPALLQKILLFVLPAAAAVGTYRSTVRLTNQRVPAVLAGTAYALSPVTMWAFSQGRIPELAFLAGLPWITTRLRLGFFPADRASVLRWVVGAAAGLAVVSSFFPGALLAAAVVLLTSLVLAGDGRRSAGSGRALGALAVAALLTFPFAWVLVSAGSHALSEQVGYRTFAQVIELSPGSAPGSWLPAMYLAIAAAIGFVFVARPLRGPASRACLAAVLCLYLAWASASGWLPTGLANAPAYMGLAAYSFCLLIGLSLASVLPRVHLATFGHRQVGAGLLVLVVGLGLLLQAAQAARGAWQIGGPDQLQPAYELVMDGPAPVGRVLWIGRRDGAQLPAPGGNPQGTADAGAASVRFAVGGRVGASALDTGRPAAGSGYAALSRTLAALLSGDTQHGGALLAPFGVQYLVGGVGDVPAATMARLAAQVDLVRVPAGGLVVFRNAQSIGLATAAPPTWSAAASADSPVSTAQLTAAGTLPLHGGGEVYRGSVPRGSFVMLSQQFDSRWSLTARGRPASGPGRAFGWADGWNRVGGAVEVRFGAQWIRTFEMALLTVLWALALWITRRPARV